MGRIVVFMGTCSSLVRRGPGACVRHCHLLWGVDLVGAGVVTSSSLWDVGDDPCRDLLISIIVVYFVGV